jgi:hypothetical protein
LAFPWWSFGRDYTTPQSPRKAVPPYAISGSSTVADNATRNVLLANAEAGFAYRFMPGVALRGFVGVNYDGGVPRIASPGFSGLSNAATSVPARIYCAHETSYCAGAACSGSSAGPDTY